MVHETATLDGPARVQSLLKRVEHEAGVRRPAHPPADDATGISIDHEGHVDEAGPGRDVGEGGDPEHVRARGLKLPIDAIERARRGLIADRGPHRLAPHGPLQAHGPHQPRHRAARHPDPLSAELSPDLADAVDAEVRLIHAPDLDHQCCIPPGSRGQPLRISPPGGMGVIRRRGDRQHPADRLDPVDGAMLVNEGDHGLDRRSSSAIAKYALALRRISLAWRNSRFSRSSARMRSWSWRKLHLGVDAETGRIVAATLTDRDEDDASQVGPLLDQVADPVASFTADGAYDQESVYADVAERHPGADVVVPPRSTAVPSATAETAPTQRDRHLQLIAEKGRMGWQKASGYNARARGRGH